MNPINPDLLQFCDRESHIYCKTFNELKDRFNEEANELNDEDLAYLGLYLCKCVEQEINSSIVQYMRYILGVEMPEYYCKTDPNHSRETISVYTGKKNISLNEWKNNDHREVLKPVPLGDAYWALDTMLKRHPEMLEIHPFFGNYKFKETWRNIGKLRNEIAHAGTIIHRRTLLECYEYCQLFLNNYMPELAIIKKELAPDGWKPLNKYEDIFGVKTPQEGHINKDWADEGFTCYKCESTESLYDELFLHSPYDVSYRTPHSHNKIDIKEVAKAIESWNGEISKATAEVFDNWLHLTQKARDEDNSGKEMECLNTLNLRLDYEEMFDWDDTIFEDKGKYGLKNILGEVVIQAKYDDFLELQSFLHQTRVIFAVKDGKAGFVERHSGRELTSFCFDNLYRVPFIYEWFFFQKDGSKAYGIVNEDGEILVPAIIDSHYELLSDSGVVYESGGMYGYMSAVFNICIKPIYDQIIIEDLDEPMIFVLNGVSGHVYKDGTFYSLDEYEKIQEDPESDDYLEIIDFIAELSNC